MRTGILKDKRTGKLIKVSATVQHPSSSYNKAVWVDKHSTAYVECDCPADNPLYEVIFDSASGRKVIGRQIADLRIRKGMSPRQLAELSGVSFSNIGKVERGVYNVSVDVLNQILDPLGAEITIAEKVAR